jgi:hypothetical protein
MSFSRVDFWKRLVWLKQGAGSADGATLRANFMAIMADAALATDDHARERQIIVRDFARLEGITLDLPNGTTSASSAEEAQRPAGVSVVTSCRDRNENLMRALPSWLACEEVSEIVIVDWSSTRTVAESLKECQLYDPRIKIIRVEDEARWILSLPFNLGFQQAKFDKVLKADADIVLSGDFFAKNPLAAGRFIAGNWRKTTKDQSHVNGFFYLHRNDLMSINGFNEYITTYGWDDDELYARLTEAALHRTDVAPNTIHHLPHPDESRTDLPAKSTSETAATYLRADTLFNIRYNRMISTLMPTWNTGRPNAEYNELSSVGNVSTLSRILREWNEVPPNIKIEASAFAARELMSWNLGERCLAMQIDRVSHLLDRRSWDKISLADIEVSLHNPIQTIEESQQWLFVAIDTISTTKAKITKIEKSCVTKKLTPVFMGPEAVAAKVAPNWPSIPEWVKLGGLDKVSESKLFNSRAKVNEASLFLDLRKAKLSAPAHNVSRQKLFIDAQHGLGNRLRAIGSAAAIADKTDRELVVVWHCDEHCDGKLTDLFDYKGAVIDQQFVGGAAAQGCTVFNYMEIEEGAEKDALIDPTLQGDIYARAAFVLNSPHSNWIDENKFLRALVPVERVCDLVASVRTPNSVSAHVRMVGGTKFEHLAFESADNWTEEAHQETDKWRTKSHFSNFMKRIDDLLKDGRADRIFLAADMPETYDEFVGIYGDRVAYLKREVYDRSAEQLQYALADALLLGSSPLLLGSTWSSFSELAMRLSPIEISIEMSGKDF